MKQAVKEDYSNATDIADYLAVKGLPFRQAHEVIGKIVLYAIDQNKYLLDLTMDEYKQFSELFEEDIYDKLAPEQVVAARVSEGATGFQQVYNQIDLAKEHLS